MNNDSKKSKSRKRGQNYTAAEKDCLLNAVFVHKDIIENNKTDSVTWKQKESTWTEIGNIFNRKSPSGIQRTIESLKKYYENLKKEGRKTVAHNKLEIKKTGGGSADLQNSIHQDLLLSIINKKTIFGLVNPFDCDTENTTDNGQLEKEQETPDMINNIIHSQETDLSTSEINQQVMEYA
ncbi:hypothetical protein ABEB36_012763 [Hypothenemus hampei]|uniref:Regulatory protein zeste n=1 Tax=Hypothenemus hampei TaxID=57062 RepID=A0ABD1EF36_HYPHA